MASFFKSKFKFKTRLKKLSDQVIVLTGASSGIGLATALSAAKQGARLVLVSRNEAALAEVQKNIEALGGEAIHIVADVGSQEDIQRVAKLAIEAYGGFDTWVNCAGVGLLGRLDEVTDEDNRRLFDTNYWGIVYGSLAAADHLKYKTGAIINLGSILSDMSVPLQGMYSASKHAVKGFTDALRHELEADNTQISITLIKPAVIGTPFFSHAKNYTTHQMKAPSPVYAPEEVAYAILHAAQHRVRDVRVGGAGVVMSAMNAHTPRLMDWLNERVMLKSQLSDKPKSRDKDNLHQSGQDGNVYGKDMPMALNSLYTRAALNPAVTSAVIAGVGLLAYAVLGRKTSNYAKLSKTALKGVNAGINVLLPLQNALMAKGMLKFFEKKSGAAAHSIRDNAKALNKAVNENTKLVKKKALSLIN